jgi:hypothetical protein
MEAAPMGGKVGKVVMERLYEGRRLKTLGDGEGERRIRWAAADGVDGGPRPSRGIPLDRCDRGYIRRRRFDAIRRRDDDRRSTMCRDDITMMTALVGGKPASELAAAASSNDVISVQDAEEQRSTKCSEVGGVTMTAAGSKGRGQRGRWG